LEGLAVDIEDLQATSVTTPRRPTVRAGNFARKKKLANRLVDDVFFRSMALNPTAVSSQAGRDPAQVQSIGDAYRATGEADDRRLTCARCAFDFGDARRDPKLAAVVAERPITASSELNANGLVGELVLREYYCPGCGSMVAANVQRRGDAVLIEMELA
jgi:acetone carboxylase gamma subunit